VPEQHPLERRSALLRDRAVAQRDALRDYIGGSGERAPFTEHLPKEAALDWWEQHIGDEYGKKLLEAMAPEKVMRLRAELGRRIAERRGLGGV
jgi:hypothetical protein